jgi:nucleotide-binding universal stress UspA family protein
VKILIATGGSSHSEKALRFGAQILLDADETPTVLTVVRRKQDLPLAEAVLQRARYLLADIPALETRARVGQPAEQIIAEAKEGGFDLVIVGERHSHTLKARMLGSTSIHVVEHAACPVIIAKGEFGNDPGEIGPIQRILLCESGALVPSLLSRFTAQLADILQGEEEITVLHVMSQMTAWPGVSDRDLQANAEELMQEHAPEGEWLASDLRVLAHPGIHAQAKVRHGSVVEEILAESEENDYDLVVIGAHREAGWQRILLEDIARAIIKGVERPVLVVR